MSCRTDRRLGFNGLEKLFAGNGAEPLGAHRRQRPCFGLLVSTRTSSSGQKVGDAPLPHCLLDLAAPSPVLPAHPPASRTLPKPQCTFGFQSQPSEASGKLRGGVLHRHPFSSWFCSSASDKGGSPHIRTPLRENISHTFCSLFRPKGATWLPQRNIMQGGVGWNVPGLSGK